MPATDANGHLFDGERHLPRRCVDVAGIVGGGDVEGHGDGDERVRARATAPLRAVYGKRPKPYRI